MPVFRVVASTDPSSSLHYLAYSSANANVTATSTLTATVAYPATVQGTRTSETPYWLWQAKQRDDPQRLRAQAELYQQVADLLRDAGDLVIVPQPLIQLQEMDSNTPALAMPHLPTRVADVLHLPPPDAAAALPGQGAQGWPEAHTLDQIIRTATLLRTLHRLNHTYSDWRVDDLRWHEGRLVLLLESALLHDVDADSLARELRALGQLWHNLLTGYHATFHLNPFTDDQWRVAGLRDERGAGRTSIGLRLLLTRMIDGYYRTLDAAGRALDVWRHDWLSRRYPPDPNDTASVERLQDALQISQGRAQLLLADLAWRLSGEEVDYRIRQGYMRQFEGDSNQPQPAPRVRSLAAVDKDVQQTLVQVLRKWDVGQPAPNFHRVRALLTDAESAFEAGAQLEDFLDAARPYRNLMRYLGTWRELPPYTAAAEVTLLRQSLPENLLHAVGEQLADSVRLRIAEYVRQIELIVAAGDLGQINQGWMYRQALTQPELDPYLTGDLRTRYEAVLPRLKNLYDFNAWFVDHHHQASDNEIVQRALERGVPLTGDTLRLHLEKVLAQSDQQGQRLQGLMDKYRGHLDRVQRTLEDEVTRVAQQIEQVREDASSFASSAVRLQADTLDSRLRLLEGTNRRYASRGALRAGLLAVLLLLFGAGGALALFGANALNQAQANLTAVAGTVERIQRLQGTQNAVFGVLQATITADVVSQATRSIQTAQAQATQDAQATQQILQEFSGTVDAERNARTATAQAATLERAALATEVAAVRTRAARGNGAASTPLPTAAATLVLATNTPANDPPTASPTPTLTRTLTPTRTPTPRPDSTGILTTVLESDNLRGLKYSRLPNLTETTYTLTFAVSAAGVPRGLPQPERGSALANHMERYVLPALAQLGNRVQLQFGVREQTETRSLVMPVLLVQSNLTYGALRLQAGSMIYWRQNGETVIYSAFDMPFETNTRLLLATSDVILALEAALGLRAAQVRLPLLDEMVPVQLNTAGQVVGLLLRDESVLFMRTEARVSSGQPGANMRQTPNVDSAVVAAITDENVGTLVLPDAPGAQAAVASVPQQLLREALLRENRIAVQREDGVWYLARLQDDASTLGWVRGDGVSLLFTSPQPGLPVVTPLMLLRA